MATQAIEQVGETTEAAPAPEAAKKGGRGVLLLALAGVVAGGAAGVFALGPMLTKRVAHKAPATHAAATAVPVVHEIANLVLNPSGTGGTRFLMVTATFQVKDADANQLLVDHEAEVRDRILSLLGKKTVDQLADIEQRDEIKREVMDSVATMFPKGSLVNLYFPQFVIQ
ncbi:MAG TPA: flagellar basal body-associated FliL family protein [Gemmatimonadaceae bacterium]|nr:flagellar basal body-associated FliL family protein [Gemmatimonadaceae bacterium]